MSIFKSLFTPGYRIRSVNGDFWNEDTGCFGPECAATVYETRRDVPCYIGACAMQSFGSGGIRYYLDDNVDSDAIARVVS